jgi:tripartite-type tricarboxylate transporter receptor subunit TctC
MRATPGPEPQTGADFLLTQRHLVARIERQRNPGATEQVAPSVPDVAIARRKTRVNALMAPSGLLAEYANANFGKTKPETREIAMAPDPPLHVLLSRRHAAHALLAKRNQTAMATITSTIRLALLFMIALAAPVAAQPVGKPITIVVPFPPGSALDLVARLAGAKLADPLGQPVVVENRTGANGTLGASAVARAAPDGQTLLFTTASTHVTAVHLMKSLPYDPLNDFTPIVAAVEPVTCLVVNSALPVNSVPELVAYAKARPGALSYGSSGVGSVFHLMGELLNQTAGVQINHVPYRGSAPALQDVVAGHIPMAFVSLPNALTLGNAGSVKILAVLEPMRFTRRADIPSMAEAVPAFRKPSSWFGVFGPAGLPAPIVARLNSEIVKALAATDMKAKLDENGMAVIGGTPADFRALIVDGIARYGAIIKAAGVKPE